MPVLGTKVHVPRPRPRLVARPRLTERLDAAVASGVRLVLVSAPAGFGKTTLLTQWLGHRHDRPAPGDGEGIEGAPRVAWLSLDAGDGDPHRFLTHLVTAVRSSVPAPEPDTGTEALALLEADPGLRSDDALVSLVNDLDALSGHTVLCLDDYHVVDAAPVHEALAFLVDNLPPQVTLAMTTRSDPPLPLPRLRARGELVEVRAADLRFTEDEAGHFLNDVMGLALAEPLVAALESRTEGWAAGLQLAALSAGSGGAVDRFVEEFTGSHRFVLDYLLEEVLDAQPDDVRSFLLDTCVLDELTGALCDAVTGRTDGQRTLEALERANLFVVPLDEDRRWWRYHHLFADALRARLRAADPSRAARLHRVAAGWYAAQGRLVDAVPHALVGDDVEEAADLLELVLPGLRRRREDRLLRAWLREVPEDVARRRPLLATALAWVRLSEGDLPGVDSWLDAAEAALAARPAGGPDSRTWPPTLAEAVRDHREEARGLPAMVAVYRASVAQARGDVAGTVAHARRALDVAAPDDHFPRGAAGGFLGLAAWAAGDLATAVETFGTAVEDLRAAGNATDVLGSTVVLAGMWTGRGRLDEARRLLERDLDRVAAPPGVGSSVAGDLHVALAEVRYEEGDLGAADHHLDVAAELGERGSLPENRHRWYTASAAVRRARGDLDGALTLLDEAAASVIPGFLPDLRPAPAQRARVQIAQGRLAEARGWATERGVTLAGEPTYLAEFDRLTLARLVLAEQRGGTGGGADSLAAVVAMLDAVIAAAEAGGRGASVVEATFLRGLAREASGDRAAALEDVGRALQLGVPVGHRRVFLDEGLPAEALLTRLGTADAETVLRARVGAPDASGRSSSPVADTGADALSEREREVLRLLASDLSGPDIARHLYVSLNTLRTHTKHIFTKLGVTTRRAAVARGSELGLL